jgi:hypothetical protein
MLGNAHPLVLEVAIKLLRNRGRERVAMEGAVALSLQLQLMVVARRFHP